MASPISTGTGLGSGLDITSIVTALVNADKVAKQTQITTQNTLVTSKISGVGTLQSALATYQTALTNLGNAASPSFTAFGATSSDTDIVGATADSSAVAGSYTIDVSQLATSSKVATASFADGATSAISSGNLKISQNGTDYNVAIPEGSTLQSVRDAVNASALVKAGGISANIITDSQGSRLIFSSTTTGSGSDITTSGIDSLTIAAGTKMDGTASSAGYVGTLAQDAKFTIDGLSVVSASNTATSISGLSLNLLKKGESTVTVAQNTDGLKASLNAFVSAYNAVVTTITNLSKATADPTTGALTVPAAMTGDSLPRSLLSAMREVLVTPGPGSTLSTLAQLGIRTSQSGGTLTLDETKFTAAMTDKSMGSQIQQLFTGTPTTDGTASTDGLLSRMSAVITPYTQTGGILAARTTNLTAQQLDLQDQQDALNLRVTTLTATLTAKYNAMDLVVAQLKATATSITSFFDSLNAQASAS